MSTESNIILITNDDNVAQILKPKLVLLREIDNILLIRYEEALENVRNLLPEVVLLYCGENEKDRCLDVIKQIKSDDKTKSTSILLVINEYNQDFVLSSYDENIDDFLTLNTDDAEILMRTIWCIKKSSLSTKLKKQNKLLEELGVINKETGCYTNEYCDKIFINEFKNLKESDTESMLLLVSSSEECKTRLNPVHLAKAIKTSTRETDIVVEGSSNRFFVLLTETQLKGAFCVWEKIKRALGEQYTICAGISVVGEKSFEELKVELLKSLIEAVSTNQELVIVNEEEKDYSGDWLDKINSAQKNFKLFKQAFTKKLEKVIAPIFFQMQKAYEEKLFQTQIEQFSNPTLSSFVLKNDSKVSELKITYPGFSKINIDFVHQGLDSPENKRISLDLTELDESRLTQILEEFIQEFKKSEQ